MFGGWFGDGFVGRCVEFVWFVVGCSVVYLVVRFGGV